MRLDPASERLRVFDGDNVVCRIDVDGWSESSEAPDLNQQVDAAVAGQTSCLRFPPGRVARRSSGTPDVGASSTGSSVRAPLEIDGPVPAVLAFDGPGTVTVHPDGIEVVFTDARPVRVGVRGTDQPMSSTITVPGTPEGVATALTYASTTVETTTPSRSHPRNRRNPPRIERGESVTVPEWIRSERRETGVTLHAPPDVGTLLVLGPLAYYLGARVSISSRDTPLLRAPEAGVYHELAALPRLQVEAASLLYRCVVLDCLARVAGGERGCIQGRLLDAVGIDPERITHRSLADRLSAYLDVSIRDIKPDLPEWHLSVYMRATPDDIAALGYVLDRLAFVYLPDASRLPEEERLQRSLEDFYRGAVEAPSVDPILPDLNRGRLHGWLADGIAIDAFRLLPEAHTNRRSQPAVSDEQLTVTLVINDDEMAAEANAVRRIYRGRADVGDVDLRVRRQLDRDTLAAELARPVDLFHYVGHCDTSGLRCTDGRLDAAGLDHSGAKTFFLNACGSYHQGVSLVESGSVAGAVTLRPVLDGQAKRVGTAFARLLTRGFAVERGLRIASRRAIMNKDYAVVGDGAYALRVSDPSERVVLRISRTDDRFDVRAAHGSANATATYREPLVGDGVCLSGTGQSASMSRAELCSLLCDLTVPAVYEGQYYWAPDLRRLLQRESDGR